MGYGRAQVLTGSLLLGVAGRVVAVGVQGLRPLLAGGVTGLVRVPRLLTVVAELGAAALSAAHQPGTAGTARGDDSKPEHREQIRFNWNGIDSIQFDSILSDSIQFDLFYSCHHSLS